MYTAALGNWKVTFTYVYYIGSKHAIQYSNRVAAIWVVAQINRNLYEIHVEGVTCTPPPHPRSE